MLYIIDEEKTSEDKTNENKSSEDNASDDKTSEDKTSDDKTSDDKTSDDKTSEASSCVIRPSAFVSSGMYPTTHVTGMYPHYPMSQVCTSTTPCHRYVCTPLCVTYVYMYNP